MTSRVDFAAIADAGIIDSDEFVTQDAAIVHIAASQLQVGVADPGNADAEDDFPRAGRRFGKVTAKANGGSIAENAAH
ncbi:MAG: hypothetical protein JWN86_2995 [Planctomycetota bacterium]|nr:hypothetical protein [Planctomycetota bacterium]